MAENQYDSSSITVLSDTSHVRLRKGMYIGDAYDPSHLFSEAFDNAIDEVQSGYSDRVDIDIDTKLNLYQIRDYGRGIPHGKKKLEDGTEKEIIEVVCTKSFSGGKFNNDSYVIRSGLNGVGLVCINALSNEMTIASFRDGKEVKITTSKGQKLDLEYKECNGVANGTKITFIPDPEMFTDNHIPVSFILNRCRIASAFGMKTNLRVDGIDVDTSSDIFDLVKDEDQEISEYCRYHDEVKLENGERIQFALMYTSDTSYRSKGYTNLLPNSQGGTHLRIVDQAIGEAWQTFDTGHALWKDYFLGLRTVVAAFISDPSFSSQTKERLTTDKKQLEKFIPPIKEKIVKWLSENEDLRKGLIKRFNEYRDSQNKLLSKKEIRDLIVINNDTSGTVRRKSVIAKLNECSSKSRDDTELFIVEGDSAAGSLIQGRDIKTQAILPIRGKILNASRFSDVVKCMKNEEIRSIVNAIGAGILDDCDAARSRYERVIICADADPDGLQISSLVMSVMINLLPGMVTAGRVFISNPPLYGWRDKQGYHFTSDQNEIPDGVSYKRYKGLGEMNPDELAHSIMNKESRSLTQVLYPDDVDLFNNILTSASVKYDILYDMGLIKYID